MIEFPAVAGSLLGAKLSGEGLEPGDVTLFGPEGEVPLAAGGKPGKVKIAGAVLAGSTGTWRLVLSAPGPVEYRLSLKLPPKPRGDLVEE